MQMMRAIFHALGKDIRLELRRGYALGGLSVFVLCIVFVIYLAVPDMEAGVWVSVYWVSFLFLSIHTALKSFAQESDRRFLYYYMLLSPEVLFIAKCIYNAVVLAILSLLMYGALAIFTGSPVVQNDIFLLAIGAGALGVSLCFTFISGIAIKSNHSATLMTILSFPVVIPILLSLIKLSQAAIAPVAQVPIVNTILILTAIDLILVALGLLLFPYLWKS